MGKYGKYGPEKTPYLDTFRTVAEWRYDLLDQNIIVFYFTIWKKTFGYYRATISDRKIVRKVAI